MWSHHPEKTKEDISPCFFWSSTTEAAFHFHWAIWVLSIMAQASTALRSEEALSPLWGVWPFDITPSHGHKLESSSSGSNLSLYNTILFSAQGIRGQTASKPTDSSGYFQGALAKMVLTQHSIVTKTFPLLSVAENRWSLQGRKIKARD